MMHRIWLQKSDAHHGPSLSNHSPRAKIGLGASPYLFCLKTRFFFQKKISKKKAYFSFVVGPLQPRTPGSRPVVKTALVITYGYTLYGTYGYTSAIVDRRLGSLVTPVNTRNYYVLRYNSKSLRYTQRQSGNNGAF